MSRDPFHDSRRKGHPIPASNATAIQAAREAVIDRARKYLDVPIGNGAAYDALLETVCELDRLESSTMRREEGES